jgi:hypothetical protein
MNRLARVIIVLCALALPVTAFAIVPDPTLSDTPPCVRVTPDGSLTVVGTVIGTDGNPLGNEEVRLIISAACTDVRLCPDAGTPPQFVITTTGNASGDFSFAPTAGGCCSATAAAEIHADPGDVTLLPSYNNIGSPDNGGDGTSVADLLVNLNDFSRFSQAFLGTNACYDYTVTNPAAADYCDGEVLLADFSIFAQRFLTSCP